MDCLLHLYVYYFSCLRGFWLRASSRSISLLLASSRMGGPASFSVRSPWWRRKEMFRSGVSFVNKLGGASFCSDLARTGRHGGGGGADLSGSEAPWEDGETASASLRWSSSPVVPRRWSPSSRCIYWPFERLLQDLLLLCISSLFLPADVPKGRIFDFSTGPHLRHPKWWCPRRRCGWLCSEVSAEEWWRRTRL